jgi:hypothetical protein
MAETDGQKLLRAEIAHYERQLAEKGRPSLERSRTSLQKRIDEHVRKLHIIEARGGYTSSVHREIAGFSRQIEAIDAILGASR